MDWASMQDEDYINMNLDKAYERTRWDYILAILNKADIGSRFCRLVETLFKNTIRQG